MSALRFGLTAGLVVCVSTSIPAAAGTGARDIEQAAAAL